jgi:ATP-dependent helicase HrpB
VRLADRTSFEGGARRGRGNDFAEESDIVARLADVRRTEDERMSPGEMRAIGLDAGAVAGVMRSYRRLRREVSRRDAGGDEATVIGRALLVAFSDRVGRRRKPGSRDLVLSSGGSAQQSEESVVHAAPFVVVVGVTESDARRGSSLPEARLVSAIEPEWLLELFPDRIKETQEVIWNDTSERVEIRERLFYDAVILDETRKTSGPEDAMAKVLSEAALARGLSAFVSSEEALTELLSRARFVGELDPTFPRFDEEGLKGMMAALCAGRRSFAELRETDLLGELRGRLSPSQSKQLEAWAPTSLELRGRSARIHYDAGKPPWVESRLQDFFGMSALPAVGGGRVSLVVHLLAPSQRPVQITADLAGFWRTMYPTVRRELCRKYPRHAWPEDPMNPPPLVPRRPR